MQFLLLLINSFFKRYITYFEQYAEYDPFFTPPEFNNPWLLDNVEIWDCDKHSCVILFNEHNIRNN